MPSSTTEASRKPADIGRAWKDVLLAPDVRHALLRVVPEQAKRYEQADFFNASGVAGCVLVDAAIGLLVLELIHHGFKFLDDQLLTPDGDALWQKLLS